MFTIYIHILEVLAGRRDGTFADDIHQWGICFEKKDIEKGLKSLEKEGFVTKTMLGKVRIWHITEKALEYTWTVNNKRDNLEREEKALAMHEEIEKRASNPAVGVIPGAWEELPLQMVVSGDYVFSVDEDGVPDHQYIGLANDDGSLPFDAIKTTVVSMEGGKVTMPLYGNLTIAEVIETYESNAPFKVTTAVLDGDTVTLTFEPIPHDDEFDDSYDPDVHGTPDEIYQDREYRDTDDF